MFGVIMFHHQTFYRFSLHHLRSVCQGRGCDTYELPGAISPELSDVFPHHSSAAPAWQPSVQLRVYQWLDVRPGRTHHTGHTSPVCLLTPRHSTRERKPTRALCLLLALTRPRWLGSARHPAPLAVTRDIAGARASLARAGYLQYNPSYCRVTIIIVCGVYPGTDHDHPVTHRIL